MKAPRFSYVRPESLDEALRLLAQHGEDARILAGGQSLIPTLNMRLSQPKLLIDINRIDALRGISADNGIVRVGALVRHVEMIKSPIIARHLPLIAEAMPHVAHVAVRNRGTFGGSIALADPSAEMPALRPCARCKSGGRKHAGPAHHRRRGLLPWALRYRARARRAAQEVLIPEQKRDHVSVFMELSRRHGDFAIAGLACYARFERDTVSAARLVYFGSEAKPTLASRAMAAIAGKPWTKASREAACAALADDLDPIDNTFGSPATKLHLQRVLTQRALDKAMERAMLQ